MFLFLLVSCEKKWETTYKMSEKKDTLQLVDKIKLDSVFFSYPVMKIYGDICCVTDDDGKHFFHLYSYPDFKYVASFGKKGHARNELLILLDFYIKKDKLYVLCGNDKKILVFDLLGNLNEPQIIEYDYEISIANFCVTEDNDFIASSLNADFRLVHISKDGKLLNKYIEISDNTELVCKENTHWLGNVDISPDGNLFVSPMSHGEVIDIVNKNNNTYKRVVGELAPPEYLIKTTNSMRMYRERYNCFGPLSLHSLIYVCFWGDDVLKREKQGCFVRVYTYDGTPIGNFYLGGISPSSIYVDEKNCLLYCLEPETADIYIYKIDIPKL